MQRLRYASFSLIEVRKLSNGIFAYLDAPNAGTILYCPIEFAARERVGNALSVHNLASGHIRRRQRNCHHNDNESE